MMTHLHLNKKKVKPIPEPGQAPDLIPSCQEEERKQSEVRENGLSSQTPEPVVDPSKPPHSLAATKPLGFGPPLPSLGFPPNLGALGGFPGPRPPGFGFLPPGGSAGMQGPIRRRITDKAPMSLPSGQSTLPASHCSR